MLRNFLNDDGGSFAVSLAKLAVPTLCVFAVGYDHVQFSALKQRLPDAAMQAVVPAVEELMRGTTDLRKLEKITADFMSVNLPEVDPGSIDVTLTFPGNGKGETISGLNIYATVIYKPVSGFIANIAPARSEDGLPWIASFGVPIADGTNKSPNS